jgi:16S rRNA (uracil1498-N3)-methyltransferase
MHRFFLPPQDCGQDLCYLSPADSRHAQQVLRLRLEDQVQIIDGQGGVIEARVVELGKRSVGVRLESKAFQPRPKVGVHLALSLLKPRAMEWALQKAVELGVESIALLAADRSVSRWQSEGGSEKIAKWQTLITEAMKQCGQAWKPSLESPVSVIQWLENLGSDTSVFLGHLGASAPIPLLMDAASQASSRSFCWCVGPEGDFTSDESARMIQQGVIPCTLGPLVLRSETAVISGLSILSQLAYRLSQQEA